VLGSALSIAEQSDERCQEAELYRLEGELAVSEGKEPIEVEASFLRAIGTARKQQSKAWELRASTSLARLYQRLNRRDQARTILGQALDCFTEGFGTPDLRDATRLLEELRAG
jgi:predicted ATPase